MAGGSIRADEMGTPRPRDERQQAALRSFGDHLKDEPGAIAAIKVLLELIQSSAATTIMGLQIELQAAADLLRQHEAEGISIASGCELFMRFVTRTALDHTDYDECKTKILQRGEFFKEHSTRARARIAELGAPFLRDGASVLTTGYSRVVLALLLHAASVGKRRFSVVIAESHADGPGHQLARALLDGGIPVTMVDEAAVAVALESAHLVLVGAEGVVENGGIISKVGTCQMGIIAKAIGRPVYVAAESFKFVRQYPLNQADVLSYGERGSALGGGGSMAEGAKPAQQGGAAAADGGRPGPRAWRITRDYTAPRYINLLFTDLGVLTPSAVSDELIKLYY